MWAAFKTKVAALIPWIIGILGVALVFEAKRGDKAEEKLETAQADDKDAALKQQQTVLEQQNQQIEAQAKQEEAQPLTQQQAIDFLNGENK